MAKKGFNFPNPGLPVVIKMCCSNSQAVPPPQRNLQTEARFVYTNREYGTLFRRFYSFTGAGNPRPFQLLSLLSINGVLLLPTPSCFLFHSSNNYGLQLARAALVPRGSPIPPHHSKSLQPPRRNEHRQFPQTSGLFKRAQGEEKGIYLVPLLT